MNQFIDGCLSQRIDQITKTLLETNGDYARADHQRNILWEKIEPIVSRDTDIMLYDCDRMDFEEYFEQLEIISLIENHALYRQGVVDCVGVLKKLGVLQG